METEPREEDGGDLAPRSFVFDFTKADDTEERWELTVYRAPGDQRLHRSVSFYRNGISMGGGTVGFESVTAGPSGQRTAAPKLYPSGGEYRVGPTDEAWFLAQLQAAGAVESLSSMVSRGIDARHRRRGRARRAPAR